ncbi:uncharacterized protein LOC111265223 [Varroa jacobsoni]|uniref:U5 small nuclear ribonucleoprotein TSSC4 n=1 Tax=Varroa destructor TaxID=109461 RepID=A0A7M7KPE0_VARDE|nr:uncharacterized protein LOC111253212 [Varroa destructor]XP_022697450.1 uncharacterized protein LOC111265223 [Varroa jacobsoni]
MSSSPFRLRGLSDTFLSKADMVFAGLGLLEKQHDDWAKSHAKKGQPSPQQEEPDTLRNSEFLIPYSRTQLDRRNQNGDLRKRLYKSSNQQLYSSRDHQFLHPRDLPCSSRSSKVPDHRLHPERWTKYSLDSVSDNDLSDRGNAAAAMNFLQKQATAYNKDNSQLQTSEGRHTCGSFNSSDLRAHFSPGSINFSKRSRRIEVDQSNEDARQPKPLPKVLTHESPLSAAPRRIVPEHVVGSRSSPRAIMKKRSIVGPKTGDGDRIKLSHLVHNEDSDLDHHMHVNQTRADSTATSNVPDIGFDVTSSRSSSANKGEKAKQMSASNNESGINISKEIDDPEARLTNSPPTVVKRRRFRGDTRTRNMDEDDD